MDHDFGVEIIIPIILALIAILPSVANFIRSKKRDISEIKSSDADAAESIVSAATALITPLKERVAFLEECGRETHERQAILEERIKTLEQANFILCSGLARLAHQLKSHGIDPVFFIPEGLCEKILNGTR